MFCHAEAPIQRIEALARELADKVKDSPQGRETNAFACEVLESFDHTGTDLDDYYRRRYKAWGKSLTFSDLVLDGGKMPALQQAMQELEAAQFPHRRMQVHSRELLAGKSPAFTCEGYDLGPLEKAITRSSEPSRAAWLHTAMLWNYVARIPLRLTNPNPAHP